MFVIERNASIRHVTKYENGEVDEDWDYSTDYLSIEEPGFNSKWVFDVNDATKFESLKIAVAHAELLKHIASLNTYEETGVQELKYLVLANSWSPVEF